SFWFELPLGVEAWAAHHPEAELTGARVLLVQYGEREERTVRRYLEHGGVGKIDAVTGKGGELGSRLEALEKGYDLVLVSAREGASALKGVLEELRRHGATASSRDAVTAPHLAASVLRADARSLSDMQWLATLTTPIRMRRLWQVVGAAIGKVDLAKVADRDEPKLAEYEAPALAEALSAGVAILVAEDNGTNQIVIRRILNRLGFAHEMAGNGVEALKLWEEKRGSYGLLLSDFHMPEMDGFELTQAIREREAKAGYPRLPIVALTADALPQTEKQCLDAGMDGYLRKPIEMPALVAALEKWLPNALNLRKEKGAAKAKPPEPAPPAPQPAAEPQGAILDRSRLEEIFGDEEDEAKAFVASFVSHAQGMVDDVARHLEAGEATEAREVAHALKGAARSVGAMRLGDAAAEVQDCLDRKDVDAARGSFPAIQATYRDFADHVQSLGWQAETAEGS
ncbi:MAG: response regulator, partial [Alphaproteobacteria bacterium]|nr:response regulator [Alphaproteobacteria bacterium]